MNIPVPWILWVREFTTHLDRVTCSKVRVGKTSKLSILFYPNWSEDHVHFKCPKMLDHTKRLQPRFLKCIKLITYTKKKYINYHPILSFLFERFLFVDPSGHPSNISKATNGGSRVEVLGLGFGAPKTRFREKHIGRAPERFTRTFFLFGIPIAKVFLEAIAKEKGC